MAVVFGICRSMIRKPISRLHFATTLSMLYQSVTECHAMLVDSRDVTL